MKKEKTTLDFIKPREEKLTFSVKIRESLYTRVDHERQQIGASWVDLVEGMFKKFLHDSGIEDLKPKS